MSARAFGERGGEVVALVHGWGGAGGQLLPFVEPLVAAGKRVVLFDGHGESAPSPLGWRQSSFVEVARSLLAVLEQTGAPRALVAHSGGAIASVLALEEGGLRPQRLALLAPMARPHLYADRFDAALGLSPAVSRRWRSQSEERVGFRWSALDLTTAAARMPLPGTLVVHDRRDKEVPFAEGEALSAAWGAALVETSGLGHQRLLADPAVVRRVAEFVAAR